MTWIQFTAGVVFRLRQHSQTKRRFVNYSSHLGILPVNNAKCGADHNFSSSVELKKKVCGIVPPCTLNLFTVNYLSLQKSFFVTKVIVGKKPFFPPLEV